MVGLKGSHFKLHTWLYLLTLFKLLEKNWLKASISLRLSISPSLPNYYFSIFIATCLDVPVVAAAVCLECAGFLFLTSQEKKERVYYTIDFDQSILNRNSSPFSFPFIS